MSTLSTQPYKGTRDFYPADMRVRQWMFGRLRTVLGRFGYEEYDGPMLEPFELYAAKTSEEIVNEQLYWLIDRGERKLAMRPEMTPTLARMVAARRNELPRPIRWYSIPNLWRYERPQRGRLREHWQLNVDVFGGDQIAEDLEICQLVASIMEGFGAKDGYEVRLNHRALTNYLLWDILKLAPATAASVGRLLDAAPKMGREPFLEGLKKEGLAAAQIEKLDSLFHIRHIQDLLKLDPALENAPGHRHLATLLGQLHALGIAPRFRFDPSIMRGFLYYTGLVLEVYDLHPDNNRALFGGGRYDNLVGAFGGERLSGVGFGMGDVTLRNFLETHKLLPGLQAPRGVFIAYLGEEDAMPAQLLARDLRAKLAQAGADIPVLTALLPERPKKVFTAAEKLGARAVIFVGPDDRKAGRYPLKDLVVKGEQVVGDAGELAEHLRRMATDG